jgi:hypothetical protein
MSIFDRGDEERAARLARNQAIYRDVNERVRAINEAFDNLLPLGEWLCECANPECLERLSITHEEYEQIRADGTHFAIAPQESHVFPEVEDVIERHERYWVVEKQGVAARVVETVDPRSAS